MIISIKNAGDRELIIAFAIKIMIARNEFHCAECKNLQAMLTQNIFDLCNHSSILIRFLSIAIILETLFSLVLHKL